MNPANSDRFSDYSYQGAVALDNAYYTVQPMVPLSRWVQCFWQLNIPTGKYRYRSVPDNNVDIIFNLNEPSDNFVVAPFCTPQIFQMEGPETYFGIRLRLLAQHWFTELPVGEWNNASVADIFSSVLQEQLQQTLVQNNLFETRCEQVSKLLLANINYRAVDKRFTRFVHFTSQQLTSVNSLSERQCSEFGLSSRHLRRLSQLYLGISPRNFQRVSRFQKTLHLIEQSGNMADWAQHYYDQSHFIREFKSLAGLTPGEFYTSSVLYNSP